MFVDTTKVPIALDHDPANVIFIRPKMDFGTKARVLDAIAKVQATDKGASVGVGMGAYQLALLQHNIVGWEGPAFGAVPCSPEAVARLDPDEPLVARVVEEIATRNPLGRTTRRASTAAGAPSSTANGASPPASGISTSPSPSATTGPRSKSIDSIPTS